jgi:ribonuclease P protein component
VSPEFGFPREARLLTAGDFTLVYRHGTRFRVAPLRFCALRRRDGRPRLGLSIGRKVGGAVVRNRWKRAVREAFRLERGRLAAPWDLVVSVDYGAALQGSRRVREAMRRAVDQLNAQQEAEDEPLQGPA